MKKSFFLAAILFVSIAALAQNGTLKTTPAGASMPLKEHVCTAACTNGNHVYAHGEKGHVCTDACKAATDNMMPLKEHVCTKKCKHGKHVYAHGEKGHVCTAACKKEN